MPYDLMIKNATLVTQNPVCPRLEKATITVAEGKIQTVTDDASVTFSASEIIDAQTAVVTPGFIDCHTHLVYGGNRASEFRMRLAGATYEEVAKAGGGIMSTVKATREAGIEILQRDALKRVRAMQRHGTTTVEIKSGYGLDLETEIKMLKTARSLEKWVPVSVYTTFLGAHTVPLEYKSKPDAYIDFVIEQVLPVVTKEKLADAVDAFCETIAFSPAQVKRLFNAAIACNLPIKLHAEQLSEQRSAVMASELGARSVEHLEYLASDDCSVLANNNTVAVLLPGAFYFLKEQQKPPVEALRKEGVRMAIATDCNPGSSPFVSLPLMMNMACILFGFTVEEAFAAVTVNAARALGVDDSLGCITEGKCADLVVWNTCQPTDIVYNPTLSQAVHIVKKGKLINLLPWAE